MTVNEKYSAVIKFNASQIFSNRKHWMRETEAQIVARLTQEEIAQIATFQKDLAKQATEKLAAMVPSVKAKIAAIEAGEFIDNIEFLRFLRRAIALKRELVARGQAW